MSLMTRIEPQPNLTEQAVRALRREIVACRLAPGETISETLMSERFAFGRAAMRSALARLADEGLVQAVPRRGWVVSVVTIRDIHEVFDLRLMLEPEAARRAAAPHAGLERLRQLDDACATGYRPEDPDSALDFLAVNREFHVAVAELAGNQRLARQIGRLLDESTRMLVLGLSTRDRSGEMAHEHRALVQAMADHNPDAAATIMHQQVSASRDMVLTALTGPRSTLVVSEFA
jgi:DNA-binding GntR family transcriptional regulator